MQYLFTVKQQRICIVKIVMHEMYKRRAIFFVHEYFLKLIVSPGCRKNKSVICSHLKTDALNVIFFQKCTKNVHYCQTKRNVFHQYVIVYGLFWEFFCVFLMFICMLLHEMSFGIPLPWQRQ